MVYRVKGIKRRGWRYIFVSFSFFLVPLVRWGPGIVAMAAGVGRAGKLDDRDGGGKSN